MFTGKDTRGDGTDPHTRRSAAPIEANYLPIDSSHDLEPLRSVTGPAAVRRAEAGSEEPPGESPIRADPTNSWSYRWLGVGIVGGTVAGLGVAAGATWLSTSLLSTTGSTLVFAGTLALAAVQGARPLLVGIFGNRFLTQQDDYSPGHTRRRVEDTVRALCLKAGDDTPAVVASSRVKNMAMFDGPGKSNVLIFNPDFVERLTNRELEGIVAHELSHADRYTSISRLAMLSARQMAGITTLVGTASYCLAVGDGIVSSSLLGIAAAVAVRATIQSCWNIASRADEMRTDIRAVELTQDLGSLIKGLGTAHDYMFGGMKAPPVTRTLELLGSHPPLDVRERWMRRACGNNKKDAGQNLERPESPERVT